MPEEKRGISPAVVIIPIGLGLAAIAALAALAWATPEVFTCPYCGAEFSSYEELVSHIESEHPGEPVPLMPPLTHFTLRGVSWPDDFILNGEHMGKIIRWDAEICLSDEEGCPADAGWSGTLFGGPVDVSRSLHFTLPVGWLSAIPDIPNSLKIRIGGKTDLGWTTWICDSPVIKRIPEGSLITFECHQTGCRNWEVT